MNCKFCNEPLTSVELVDGHECPEPEALGVFLCSTGDDCPNCPNQGWYAVEYRNADGTPDQAQQQCEWCYTMPNSKFNLLQNKESGKNKSK
tara:strand:+ start:513 stop:785 length:273 start_codon:yes stop_codon:yes gene_type:complete